MSDIVKKQLPLFKVIIESKPKLKVLIFKEVGKEFIIALSECCLNILRGGIKLTKILLRSLNPFKKHIRYFAETVNSIKQKKKFLVKSGGLFVSKVLKAVLPALYEYFQK